MSSASPAGARSARARIALMSGLLALTAAAAPSDVVLTLREAAALDTNTLAARLLADLPHGPILSAHAGSTKDIGLPASPLQYVAFVEQATPLAGQICGARKILAIFEPLDGGSSLQTGPGAEDVPRRRFAVETAPLLAVTAGTATPKTCAGITRFAQLPRSAPEDSRKLVETVLAIAKRGPAGRLLIPVSCTDERSLPARPCDGPAALARLDWTMLGNVDLANPRIGLRRSLQFRGPDYWVVEAPEGKDVTALHLRHAHPAPF